MELFIAFRKRVFPKPLRLYISSGAYLTLHGSHVACLMYDIMVPSTLHPWEFLLAVNRFQV